MEHLLNAAITDEQESSLLDFKERLEVNSKSGWLEVLKDMVAMGNSGGGVLVIGVMDDGQPSDFDVTAILNYDPADITNKFFSYAGKHFAGFRIIEAKRQERTVAVIEIYGIRGSPLIFTKGGNYQGSDGKDKTAFTAGFVYFRHGAKSEPGTSDDIQNFLQREIDAIKDSWLTNIRKIMEAPEESQITITPLNSRESKVTGVSQVRIVDDPNVPAFRISEEEVLSNYPYDYTSLRKLLRERYVNFIENKQYHKVKRELEGNPLYCNIRMLNPNNSRSSKQKFYSEVILQEFDKHYTRKQETEP